MNGLKRFLVILVTIPVCFVLQMIALPRIPYLIQVPNLLLAAVLTFGFLYGKAYGLGSGVAAGLLIDVLGVGMPGFYTLIFALLGFGDGYLSEKIDSELIPILYLLLFVNELLYHVYQLVFQFLLRKSWKLGPYLTEVFLPEIFLTMIAFILLYGILIFLSKRWDLKVNKGAVKIV